jgi:transcriptional regulator with XRE-family HTH domain
MTPADYKAARERLGLTQEQLAELVGVTVRTIASRESGQHAVSREAEIAIRAIENVEPIDRPS